MRGSALVDRLGPRQFGQVGAQSGRPGLHVATQFGQHAEGADSRIHDLENMPDGTRRGYRRMACGVGAR